MNMLKIDDHELFVQDTGGDKSALLFVHGILMDHSVWQGQVDEFSSDYRVICVDLRGFGRSTAVSPEISFEDHVEDLLSVIDQLQLKDLTLIGWSMGGAIAQVFAANHSDKLSRMVLVDTTPQLLADNHFEHALPLEAAQHLGSALVENFASGCAAFCSLVAPEDEAVTVQLTAIAVATRPDVALNAFQSSGARSLLAEDARISTPTWIIAGEMDAVCLPKASQFMAETIPGCTTAVTFIEGAGHAPFLSSPVAFNAALKDAFR